MLYHHKIQHIGTQTPFTKQAEQGNPHRCSTIIKHTLLESKHILPGKQIDCRGPCVLTKLFAWFPNIALPFEDTPYENKNSPYENRTQSQGNKSIVVAHVYPPMRKRLGCFDMQPDALRSQNTPYLNPNIYYPGSKLIVVAHVCSPNSLHGSHILLYHHKIRPM